MRGVHVDPLVGVARDTVFAAAIDPLRVGHVSYSPPHGHIGIHLTDRPFHATDADAFRALDWVNDAGCENGFINVEFNEAVLRSWRGRPRPLHGTTAAVEHTSITPCYPINVATARSSVLGEQLRRVAALLGARAEGRFWVEQQARQNSCVEFAPDYGTLAFHGKPDHVVWNVFRTAVAASKELAPSALEGQLCHSTAKKLFHSQGAKYTRPAMEEVVGAYRGTLAKFGVRNLSFDFEDDVLRDIDLRGWLSEFMATGFFGDGTSLLAEVSPSRPRYSLRTAVYYRYLLQHFDRVLSVVPLDQEGPLSAAASAVRAIVPDSASGLGVVFYGRVTFHDVPDHPTRGPFHSLDDVVRLGGARGTAMRETILSVRATTPLDMGQAASATKHRHFGLVSNPEIQAALMLDEFAIKGLRFLASGNYADLLNWEARAGQVLRSSANRVGTPLADLARIHTLLR